MTTARDKFVIDFDKHTLENRIRLFKNSKYDDDELHSFFEINKKKGWDIRKAWELLQNISDNDLKKYILPVAYRPFDNRNIFWHDALVWRTVKRVMKNMLEENIGLTLVRQVKASRNWSHCLISGQMIESTYISNKTSEIAYFSPLYLYPDVQKENLFNYNKREKEPNISADIFEKLEKIYRRCPSPEEILYYIYGVFYSNIYRETYAEFLKIDFPKVPFTADENLFQGIGNLGKQLADLHLLKSPLLDVPIARYQGPGDNDRIDRIDYKENEQRIYINDDKYFEGISPKVWNYHIGGYQVLAKYLKDRKGRILEDAPHYCRIATALQKTIEIQTHIDSLYPEVEKSIINF